MEHAARGESLSECLVPAGIGGRVVLVVEVLVLLLGIEVVEVAVELVEAVHRRQVRVVVSQVVFAELASTIASLLEHFGKARRARLDPQLVARQADGGHARPDGVLAGDECRAARRARRLRIVVGEADAFHTDAVDVRRGVAHGAHAIGADVLPANVVTPDDEDVGLAMRGLLSLRQGCHREHADGGCEDQQSFHTPDHYLSPPLIPVIRL
ncbi:hypothetical protein D9M70_442830 [compost metagenome]